MMKHVLVIDDNKDICEMIKIILEMHDFRATICMSGRNVLPLIEQAIPDLILLDVMLDGIDGRDICREVKQLETVKHIPVVLISASHYLKDADLHNCYPDGFVSKPFDIEQLVETVETLTAI